MGKLKNTQNSSSRTGPESADYFRRKFVHLIILSWVGPPVFGLSFLLFIEIFTSAQILVILTTPLMPIFALATLFFAVAYFDYYARPMVAWLRQPDAQLEDKVRHRFSQFPLHFWFMFLLYLFVAPAITILSGELYTDYIAQPLDWFRIHLVALIVSIIVGLPVFFLIFDLFGQSFGLLRLSKPLLTIKTRVFLIGALVPLLIDTMLVQYYWTRTGYFGMDTFIVWLVLELLAIAGSFLFLRSFSQSLYPLRELLTEDERERDRRREVRVLLPASTDELGIITAKLIDLLEEQQIQHERLKVGNQMLRKGQTLEGMDFQQLMVDVASSFFPDDLCLLMMPDAKRQELVIVSMSASDHYSNNFYRVSLSGASVFSEAWHERKSVHLVDASLDKRIPTDMAAGFDIHNLMVVPLMKNGESDCLLVMVSRREDAAIALPQFKRLQNIAREIANARDILEERQSHQRIEKAISEITEAVSIHAGDQFFSTLTEKLSHILGADGVGIGLLSENEKDVIETSVIWLDGKFQSSIRYDLAGTPCERVVGKKICTFGSNVQSEFPDDDMLKEMDIVAYVGAPLFDSAGRALGLQFALFRKPLVSTDFEEAVMRIFAAHVSQELERQHKEAHIKHLAYFDSLTGLPNRQLLFDRLQQAVSHAERNHTSLAVMMLDLDHFKAINDSLGHTVGDDLLVEVAQRLLTFVRDEDTVARLGGDEFVILLQDLTETNALHEATRVASKIQEQLAESYRVSGHELMVTPSLGISLFPDNGHNREELLKHADTALYKAKDQGRNRFRFFSTAMNDEVVERLEMEAFLRQALEEKQFELAFQPKVSVSSGAIVGAEALLRWHHPELGEISPDRFIPVAEETGLIIPIGRMVLEMACEATTQFWCCHADCPADRRMAINVSPRQFQQPGFIQQMRDILSTYKTQPECVEIEITENVLLEGFEQVREKLYQLRDMGITIAIDDFGTGYSSLSYLKQLPLDHVKIDRSFVDGLPDDQDDVVIVQAILAMTQRLGIGAIAEGVETREQLDFLRSNGCNVYQGYYFSKAVGAESFQKLLLKEDCA